MELPGIVISVALGVWGYSGRDGEANPETFVSFSHKRKGNFIDGYKTLMV